MSQTIAHHRPHAPGHKPAQGLPAYLHMRKGTYYFKRKIPADVAAAFPTCRGQVWKSLGTALLEKAKVMLAVEVTEFDLTIASHRNASAIRRASGESPANSSLGKHRDLGGRDASGSIGIAATDVQQQLLASLNLAFEQLRALAAGTPLAPSLRALESAGHPSKPLPAKPPAANRPPDAPRPAARAANRPTLLHLLEDWKLKQTRVRTVNAVTSVVMEFRQLHGPLAVEDITRQHARAYRDQLVERQLAHGTIENRLGFLCTLVRHGRMEMVEHLTANPFENISIGGGTVARPPKERRAYEVEELNLLYASRLYTEGHRPKGQASDAAYWAPILGPFVGPRIEEVAQLRIEDVQRVNGVWCLRICNLGEDQNVKNLGSFRRVPLHDTVIRCGFLVYVAEQAKAGHERVFPTLSNQNTHGIWSNSLGKWYGRYLDSIGLGDRRLDYHSHRYTFRQQCSLCGIDNEVRDALTGHWLNSSDAGRTYMKAENRQYPFPKLVEAMSRLRYDELRVSHLFVVNPMTGVEEALLR